MDIRLVSVTDSTVKKIILELDNYQIELYGEALCFLDSVTELKKQHAYMLGAYRDNNLVAIGAVKIVEQYAELKRMYTKSHYRGQGIASVIFKKLEQYVLKKEIKEIYLETGNLQIEAITFYKKHNYQTTTSFGTYHSNKASIYLKKTFPIFSRGQTP